MCACACASLVIPLRVSNFSQTWIWVIFGYFSLKIRCIFVPFGLLYTAICSLSLSLSLSELHLKHFSPKFPLTQREVLLLSFCTMFFSWVFYFTYHYLIYLIFVVQLPFKALIKIECQKRRDFCLGFVNTQNCSLSHKPHAGRGSLRLIIIPPSSPSHHLIL